MALSNIYDKPGFPQLFGRRASAQQIPLANSLEGQQSLQRRIAKEHPKRKPKPKKPDKPGFLGF